MAILSLINNVTKHIIALEILEQKIDGFPFNIFAFILCQNWMLTLRYRKKGY